MSDSCPECNGLANEIIEYSDRIAYRHWTNPDGSAYYVCYARPDAATVQPPVLREHADAWRPEPNRHIEFRWSDADTYADHLLFDQDGNTIGNSRVSLPDPDAHAVPVSAGFWDDYLIANRRGMPWG